MRHLLIASLLLAPITAPAATTEFCLDGEFNLGYRLQHHKIAHGWVPRTWCVITEDESERVRFTMTGKSNPDAVGDWSVIYEPPDLVRIVNRESPPDVEFRGTDNRDEALSVRRMDPRRLFEEQQSGAIEEVRLWVDNGRINMAAFDAILPIHGKLPVTWSWHWEDLDRPRLIVSTTKDNAMLFRGTGHWRDIPDHDVEGLWAVTPGAEKIDVPGGRWPTRVSLQLIELADDIYVARGARTGFQHLVVDTPSGLIVADAPASWVEFHQIPAKRFLPDLPVDGISAGLIEFLRRQFPGRPIHAVALTHFHDDHAGGAPAFAAAGASIYAPAKTAAALSQKFAGRLQPDDWPEERDFDIEGIANTVTLGDEDNRVRLMPLGSNPHVFEMLGVWAVDRQLFFVSDIHVPRDEDDAPPADRATSECWFAGWAVENLPPDVQIVNSHSPVITPLARLSSYLESDTCRS
ncbi:MAG: MBL fold metallo-hydrolase, partial [Gammaproteobacteria bacterium]|nr:MBL fold metallo-hydrolase [Gammaproteobacteria bacterium]